jgi:hypothetical protein
MEMVMKGKSRGVVEGCEDAERKAFFREMDLSEGRQWDPEGQEDDEFSSVRDMRALRVLFQGRHALDAKGMEAAIQLVEAFDGDDLDSILRLHVLVNIQGMDLDAVTVAAMGDLPLSTFRGENFHDLRREAAFELFQLYWPDLYSILEKTPMDGLRFDVDAFLDSPSWVTEEVQLGSECVLLVMPYR